MVRTDLFSIQAMGNESIQYLSKGVNMAYENVSIENFGDLTVLNEQREQVTISTLWRKKTAVLVFVRHFG